MNTKTVLIIGIFLTWVSSVCYGDIPLGYYNQISGKSGSDLQTAMHDLIQPTKVLSYGSGSNSTWAGFYKTDNKGNNQVWDMYSNEVRYFSNPGESVSGMNIEHSFPKSWWGSLQNVTAYKDLHHLTPSDQKANSAKSNHALGVVGGVPTFNNQSSKVGKGDPSINYTGTVFEPASEYRGDFARMYMYMVTCYSNLNLSNSPMITTSPTFDDWAMALLLAWSRQDVVSEKELNRNEAVYSIQGNRNPFIDYPELAEYIWGTKKGEPFPGSTTVSTELINQPFTTTLDPFRAFSVSGDQSWSSDPQFGAKMSGFVGAPFANEDWLVSPKLDLSTYDKGELTFSHAINKGIVDNMRTNQSLWISDNYSDGNAPSSANWTLIEIPSYPSGTTWTFSPSGMIQIPPQYMHKANIHFAFKYISSTEEAATWEIKNVVFTAGNELLSLDPTEATAKKEIKGYFKENQLHLSDLESNARVEVYSESGQLIYLITATDSSIDVPINYNGIIIVRIVTADNCAVRKF